MDEWWYNLENLPASAVLSPVLVLVGNFDSSRFDGFGMSQSGDEVDQPAQLDGQVGNEYGQVKEYIPMEGPLEFDTMEEREAAFDELLGSYGNTGGPN